MRKITEEFTCDICGVKQIVNSGSQFDEPTETFSIVVNRNLFNQEYKKFEDICESCCDKIIDFIGGM